MKIFYIIIMFLIQIYSVSSKDNLIHIEDKYFKETDYSNLKKIVEKYKDQIAVSVVPLQDTHTPYFFKKSEVFVSASMIKLLIF